MPFIRRLSSCLCIASLAACATAPPQPTADDQLGVLWVKHAAEYRALTLQAYNAALDALPHYIDDRSWSALPGQTGAEHLPPAIIFDVDETLVSNVGFQLDFDPPFANWKLEQWNRDNAALAIEGATEFVSAARQAGVTTFFVTNRPCEPIDGEPGHCPQEQTTLEDLREVGIETDAEHLMLSRERPDWRREKVVRREYIARTHRVIMLVGDDLGDFIPCVRTKVYAPCTAPATGETRAALVRQHRHYWGAGWYILPNPMHGSWTSAE